ncbi:MAG: hypothetical protein K2M10_01015 [Muribaculaceae bacterium]|nr:hypothetical protein [Muribaculaceae bacterium]
MRNQHSQAGIPLLREALTAFSSLDSFRRRRERCKDYTFGRQWNDYIYVDGHHITEEEYILSEGNIPLKNNLIRHIVRNIVGVFRSKLADTFEAYPEGIKRLAKANSLYETYSRGMEEFLISGMTVHKKWVGVRNGKSGIWTDHVSPASFFFNSSARDPSGRDFSTVGQLHDVDPGELLEAFADSPTTYRELMGQIQFAGGRPVRIVELWRREHRARRIVHNPAEASLIFMEEDEWERRPDLHSLPNRWVLQEIWRVYFISAEGRIIKSSDSPYPDGSHPYVFKAYPFLDGEIHSLVGDTIDQQRYTNRLITMYDWIMRASAKGVLLLPQGAVRPEEIENVVRQWSRFNGVIMYDANMGVPEPRQVNGVGNHQGISELLQIQLKMMEDVSGVSDALRGKAASSGMSGALFNQQTENSLTSLLDIFDTFASFIDQCAAKDSLLLSALKR